MVLRYPFTYKAARVLMVESARALMVEEARKALEAYARGDMAAYNTHRLNARAIAQEVRDGNA